jgi:predicted DCC family thiol-disulfide oxidoreductase YuxK
MADDWNFKLLFDGECPYCVKEVRLLTRLDRHGYLVAEDIADETFDPARYGKTDEQLMATMHGVYPDGTIVTGMNVFREAYRQVGLGWLLAPTGWPVLRPMFDAFYRWFARRRVRLGRLFGRSCDSGRCAVGPR